LPTAAATKRSKWPSITQSAGDCKATSVDYPRKSTACRVPRWLIGAGALLAV
jgi:hypothetical protein